MNRGRTFPVRLAITVAACLLVAPLAAAPPDENNNARALELGNQGIALYEQQRWTEAFESFRRANELFHSPVFVLYMARSLRNTGHLLEARRYFRELLSEALGESAPEPWHRAHSEGRQELAALEASLPRVVISIAGAGATPSATVDGKPVALGKIQELDPGEHTLVVLDRGRSQTRSFTVELGQREQLVVRFAPPSNSGAPEAEANAPLAPANSQPRTSSSPALILTIVGGGVMVAGGVVGVLALRKKSRIEQDLPETCDGSRCPAYYEQDIETEAAAARRLGWTADLLLVGGGLVATAGLTWWIVDSGDQPRVEAGLTPNAGFVRWHY